MLENLLRNICCSSVTALCRCQYVVAEVSVYQVPSSFTRVITVLSLTKRVMRLPATTSRLVVSRVKQTMTQRRYLVNIARRCRCCCYWVKSSLSVDDKCELTTGLGLESIFQTQKTQAGRIQLRHRYNNGEIFYCHVTALDQEALTLSLSDRKKYTTTENSGKQPIPHVTLSYTTIILIAYLASPDLSGCLEIIIYFLRRNYPACKAAKGLMNIHFDRFDTTEL